RIDDTKASCKQCDQCKPVEHPGDGINDATDNSHLVFNGLPYHVYIGQVLFELCLVSSQVVHGGNSLHIGIWDGGPGRRIIDLGDFVVSSVGWNGTSTRASDRFFRDSGNFCFDCFSIAVQVLCTMVTVLPPASSAFSTSSISKIESHEVGITSSKASSAADAGPPAAYSTIVCSEG